MVFYFLFLNSLNWYFFFLYMDSIYGFLINVLIHINIDSVYGFLTERINIY
jgi:hypothetical protein